MMVKKQKKRISQKKLRLITPEKLHYLYIVKNLTQREIALRLKAGISTIHKKIRQFGFVRESKYRINLDPFFDDIKNRYDAGQTSIAIAEYYNVSRSYIIQYLKKHNVKIRLSGKPQIDYSLIESLKDKIIENRQSGQSVKKISEQYGLNYKVLYDWLYKNNLDTRPYNSLGKQSLEEISKLYKSGLTTRQIAEKFKVSYSTTYSFLIKHKIITKFINSITDDQISKIYALQEQEFSAMEISKKTNLSISSIYRILERRKNGG